MSWRLPTRVFLCTLATDMRRSFDSLAGMVREHLGSKPFSGGLFEAAAASRRYNPGLATAVLLFMPAGGFGLWELQRAGEVGWGNHLLDLLVVIGTHLAIVVYVQAMERRTKQAG